MMEWLDRLNLQPHERRWLLVGVVILAVVLNYWLVWPFFAEWNEITTDQTKLGDAKTRYLSEITKKATYEKKVKELQKVGAEVMQEDQANRLQTTLITQASTTGVQASNFRPLTAASRAAGQTNSFFDEQQMTFDVNATENELVDFLYALGTGDSMIRVRDMNRLRLDATQTRLQTTLTVIASFQKKPKPAPATQPSRPAAVQPKGAPSKPPETKGNSATNSRAVPAKKP